MRVQAMQNGINFASGDISEVLEGVGRAGSGSAIVKAHVMTAETELTTLRADAA